jgi:ribose-phosphate pyrophosphokinase
MISTGGTIMKAYELLKKEGARDIFVVATHGLFVEDALKKLRNHGIKEIITTNSIPNETAVFDVSEILFEEIKWLKN